MNAFFELKIGDPVKFTEGEFKDLEGQVIDCFWKRCFTIKINSHSEIDTLEISNRIDEDVSIA